MAKQTFSFAHDTSKITQVPIHQNLIHTLCDRILQQHQAQLPNLSPVTVLLNNNHAVAYCRSILLEKAVAAGYPALLGPTIMALETWCHQQPSTSPKVISNHARELLLVEALREHNSIFQNSSPWELAQNLLELFDDLTRAHVQLPESADEFVQLVSTAYGATQAISATLGREALLVHTLWYAMHQQLQAMSYTDYYSATLIKLGDSVLQLKDHQVIYYCGIDRATSAELQWRSILFDRQQLQLVVHDMDSANKFDAAPDSARYLDMVFDYQSGEFRQRCQRCVKLFPQSPIESFVKVFAADNAEDEALAIDIQVRRWLLDGKTNIGIVTENRKLARRVRALLERANVQVEDKAGWALSTTSAATVVERWLQTIEENFYYIPLLDCLKSSFVLEDDEDFLECVYQLEQHIIIDENTPSDIQRYLKHIEYRKNKLRESMPVDYERLTALIKTVADAADPLLTLCNDALRSAIQFIDALMESLRRLKIIDNFRADVAGQQLLAELDKLRLAAETIAIQIDWSTFRFWLNTTLERFNFKTPQIHSPVKLMTLSDSEYYQFEALIIAGAEHQFLPHAGKQSAFFNDNVRAALNIPTRTDKRNLDYFLFRRLLTATLRPDAHHGPVLLTRRAREKDEEIVASQWLSALQAFHIQMYGTSLMDPDLPTMVASHRTRVRKDNAPLPQTSKIHPAVTIPPQLLPGVMSASAYQQLIDCPYQFMAARCYKLAPPDAVKEALQKSDYGMRIHRCLEAFHSQVATLPEPFTEKITAHNRQDAINRLDQIAQRVFSDDIEDNFMHRGWLRRWQALIPLYIDWQMQQQTEFTPYATEVNIEGTTLPGQTGVAGRIDRIDLSQLSVDKQSIAIIDYKTGKIPSDNDISNGEAIQLPFYLMLFLSAADHEMLPGMPTSNLETQVMYVDLDSNTNSVRARGNVGQQQIVELAQQNQQRLQQIMLQLQNGDKAPAWGDNETCGYCQMEGLCRKQVWSID